MFTDQLIPNNRPADPQIPVYAFHDAAVIVVGNFPIFIRSKLSNRDTQLSLSHRIMTLYFYHIYFIFYKNIIGEIIY